MVILKRQKGGNALSPKPKANSERTNVFFSPEVMDKLRNLAYEKGTSVSGLIRMIVLEYLAEKSKGFGSQSKQHRSPNHRTRRLGKFILPASG